MKKLLAGFVVLLFAGGALAFVWSTNGEDFSRFGTPEEIAKWDTELFYNYLEDEATAEIFEVSDFDKSATLEYIAKQMIEGELSDLHHTAILVLADAWNKKSVSHTAYVARGTLARIYKLWGEKLDLPEYVYKAMRMKELEDISKLYVKSVLFPLTLVTKYLLIQKTLANVETITDEVIETWNKPSVPGGFSVLEEMLEENESFSTLLSEEIIKECATLREAKEAHPEALAWYQREDVKAEAMKIYLWEGLERWDGYQHEMVMNECFK